MQDDALFTFDLSHLMQLAAHYAPIYRSAEPFPHVVIDNFLPRDAAMRLMEEFPKPGSGVLQTRFMVQQPGKFGSLGGRNLTKASPFIQHMLLLLNSFPVLDFLTQLTGIENLLSDPYFSGGGLHQIVNGGHLDVHADFSFDERIRLHRRINLLLYLNPVWPENYGGFLELWDRDMKACVHRIAPLLNRCVIFNTTRTSYHGHPQPVRLPEGVTRNSIAIYYYTVDAPDEGGKHGTLWQQLPGT